MRLQKYNFFLYPQPFADKKHSLLYLINYQLFIKLFRQKFDEWNHHLLQRDAAMLEGILIIIDIIGVVVGVRQERIACGEHERGGEIFFRQENLLR